MPASIKILHSISLDDQKREISIRSILDALFILSSPSVVKNMGEEQEEKHSKLLVQICKDIMDKVIEPILLYSQKLLTIHSISSFFLPKLYKDDVFSSVQFHLIPFPTTHVSNSTKEYAIWIFSQTMECMLSIFTFLRDSIFHHTLSSMEDHTSHWKKEMEKLEVEIIREHLTQQLVFSFANYSFLPAIYYCNPLPIDFQNACISNSLEINSSPSTNLSKEIDLSISYTHKIIEHLLDWKVKMIKEGN